MMVAEGILTARGGLVSHAAVVARGWGTPAVVGAEAVKIDGTLVHRRRRHGRRGRRHLARRHHRRGHPRRGARCRRPSRRRSSTRSSAWADEIRKGKLGVRANADNGADAANARQLRRRGHRPVPHRAHVPRRGPPARRAPHDPRRHRPRRRPPPSRSCASVQKADFDGDPRGDGRPARHRAPARPAAARVPAARRGAARSRRPPTGLDRRGAGSCSTAAEAWHELNPMIGTRGVRLGVVKPGLYAMQVRALHGGRGRARGQGQATRSSRS